MKLSDILAYLAPFEGLLKPELLKLEAAAVAKLKAYADAESSPDLKIVFEALVACVDAIAQAEAAKLP